MQFAGDSDSKESNLGADSTLCLPGKIFGIAVSVAKSGPGEPPVGRPFRRFVLHSAAKTKLLRAERGWTLLHPASNAGVAQW